MKRLTGLYLMMMYFMAGYSQVSLNFCTNVESQNGYCNFNNTKFITSPDSTNGRIFMEVRGDGKPIGATNVIFKVYKIDNDGKEKFETMLQQAIQPDWYFAWMPNVFASPGKYDVKIYNESDELMCSKAFEFIAFK